VNFQFNIIPTNHAFDRECVIKPFERQTNHTIRSIFFRGVIFKQ